MPLGFSSQEMTVHKFRVCKIISETVELPKTQTKIILNNWQHNRWNTWMLNKESIDGILNNEFQKIHKSTSNNLINLKNSKLQNTSVKYVTQ
jgi:hypothetical protein